MPYAEITKRMLHFLLACIAATLMLGCKPASTAQQFKATDITGIDSGKDFRLTDHLGKQRSLSDFKGKVVVLFFGYTHCPEACPNTLMELARAMKRLGAEAEKVQVLFVTVDPERDTQELLAQYIPSFNPKFIGLYGTPQQTADTAKAYRIFYNKVAGSTPGSYTMDHSLGSHVYDRSGKLRLLASHGMTADDLAHDIKLLLEN